MARSIETRTTGLPPRTSSPSTEPTLTPPSSTLASGFSSPNEPASRLTWIVCDHGSAGGWNSAASSSTAPAVAASPMTRKRLIDRGVVTEAPAAR